MDSPTQPSVGASGLLYAASPALRQRRAHYATTQDEYRNAWEAGTSALVPLFPPAIVDVDMRRGIPSNSAVPFLSTAAGALPHGPPRSIEDLCSQYLVNGASKAPPNLDIEFDTVEVGSNGEARRLLAQAARDGRTFWTAIHVPMMKHPPWWPARAKTVPGFEHMIVGCGDAGIGMHRDRYTGGEVTRPSTGERFVSTYLALGHGRKHVVLLPPTAEGARVAELLGGCGCDDAYGRRESQRAKLPARPHPEVLDAVIGAGGYWFDLEASRNETISGNGSGSDDDSSSGGDNSSDDGERRNHDGGQADSARQSWRLDEASAGGAGSEKDDVNGSSDEDDDDDDDDDGESSHLPLCLFIPAGWWHWLAGDSPWHVAWSGSFFPGTDGISAPRQEAGQARGARGDGRAWARGKGRGRADARGRGGRRGGA